MAGFDTLKILIVDDNQYMRTIVREILRGGGITQIQEARDGAEAFDALTHFPADIAIVDFNMAPMDGIDFTRMLRTARDSRNPLLPVIMVTGHSEKSRVEEARDAGVNEFVVKPITANVLLARLNSVVLNPRNYVKSRNFTGPERRRRVVDYNGPLRRVADQG